MRQPDGWVGRGASESVRVCDLLQSLGDVLIQRLHTVEFTLNTSGIGMMTHDMERRARWNAAPTLVTCHESVAPCWSGAGSSWNGIATSAPRAVWDPLTQPDSA